MSAPDAGASGEISSGPGRLLVALYGTFAVAATARSGVQLALDFEQAPVPYLLSAVAAVVYVVATAALLREARRTALVAVLFELVGVLVVGTLSVVGDFPDETVWSGYGAGYLYVPLVLPVLGLLWLRRTSPGRMAR